MIEDNFSFSPRLEEDETEVDIDGAEKNDDLNDESAEEVSEEKDDDDDEGWEE
jgi:hypothetical protein